METKYVGIDVSKKNLDLKSTLFEIRIDNQSKSILRFAKKYKDKDLHFICESTGGYESLAANLLTSEGFKVSIVNAKRVRQFAKACGILAKTDCIDAQVLVRYGEVIQPMIYQVPSAIQSQLSHLVDRREQLVEMCTMEKNRTELCGNKMILTALNDHIKILEQQIKEIETQVEGLIKSENEFSQKAALLRSIVGVGPILTASLLAYLPELGTLTRREVAALVGVAPFNHDSGKKTGIRKIEGGRGKLRHTLYMASQTAVNFNPILKEYYQRLKQNGKPHKVALVAVMRKLLIACNSILKNEYFSLA